MYGGYAGDVVKVGPLEELEALRGSNPQAAALLEALAANVGVLEAEEAKQDFRVFLRHVKVVDPPPEGKGVLRFVPWPHLMDLAEALTHNRLLAVLKARQLGVSWLLAAYALWMAQYHEGAVVLLLSRSEPDAWKLLGKCRTIYQELPASLRVPLTRDTSGEMVWEGHHASISALASTPDAGRSVTATLVIQDEADFHEYLDANYTAVKPTVDAGGQLVQASTSNKLKMMSLFKGLYRGVPGNGFTKRFYGWRVRPGRDDAWYERVKGNVPATEKLSPEQFMEQEYPGTEEEALSPSRARGYFDRDALVGMIEECEEPRLLLLGGLLMVWRQPVVGRKYVMGVDTAWGVHGSANAAVVLDWQTAEQVAELYGRPRPDEMALAVKELGERYNDAYLVIERAGQGQERDSEAVVVVDKLVEMGYGKRMYHHGVNWEKEEKQRGWQTDVNTRPMMLGELEEAVRLRAIRPRSRAAVGEFLTFIRNEKGRPEAAEGAHDDYVMAWAMAWQGRKYARFSVGGTSRPVFIP